jgi:Sulfotransferase family
MMVHKNATEADTHALGSVDLIGSDPLLGTTAAAEGTEVVNNVTDLPLGGRIEVTITGTLTDENITHPSPPVPAPGTISCSIHPPLIDNRVDSESVISGSPIPTRLEATMRQDLEATVSAHLAYLAEPQPWGWKEPRSIFLVPFFHRHMPSLRFLHVVRDGRDMAFSTNQNQLRKHGPATGISGSGPVDSITLWSRLNLEMADYGEEWLRSRYLRVRFEDLCAQPVETASRILAFFELEADPQLASTEVSMQASIGRWRREDRRVIFGLQQAAGTALARFGYS